jgi:hypothetical protein
MKNEVKYYTEEHIRDEFDKLTKDKKISVLYEAIDIMQQYNGRSRFLCIAMAMGYKNHEGERDTYTKSK